MYVVLLLCSFAVALFAALRAATFLYEQLSRIAGRPSRRPRRGRYVPISATHLPV